MSGERVAPEDGSGHPKDDVWIHSNCEVCFFGHCAIKVHRVNGVVVQIEGNPDCPSSQGRLCAKGPAAIMSLYDPHRVRVPLKRTNPEKGTGLDPRWVEISWEEALETIVKKLREVREDDPRKLVCAAFDSYLNRFALLPWGVAFGSPNLHWANYFCGQAWHPTMWLTGGTFIAAVDLDHCNYCLSIGSQLGFGVSEMPNIAAQKMADARMRGMKLVIVDPICTNAASKADEWIPIRPGTDGALVLAMLNVLLNELGLYDAYFIKQRTNGPYLVGPDGLYVREKGSNKPLLWDPVAGEAKPHDAEAADCALEGSYLVEGVACQPAFQLLKNHLRKYTPEMASQITTVRADTIRRIAQEFAEAAKIGSKIVIEGKELPYRPAAANQNRGANSHKHGMLTALAIELLNTIVGSTYAVGGRQGINLVGPWWGPKEADGLVVPPAPITASFVHGGYDSYQFDIRLPESLELSELFPIAYNRSPITQLTILDPEKMKLPYKPEVLLHCRSNIMMNRINRDRMAESLQKIPFIVSFAIQLDEATEFADIVLPEVHQLERLNIFPNTISGSVCPGTGYWYWGVRQPVVQPAGEARSWVEVLIELADRLGFLSDLNTMFNMVLSLEEPYRLDPQKRYNWEEISDRMAKSRFGPEKGLDWFKEHGPYKVKRRVEEIYPGPFLGIRFPLYFENILRAGREVQRLAQQLGIPWDTSDYQPLPDWKPCPAYEEKSPQYDLYAVNYKIPLHSFSFTTQNPWLNELAEHHPYAYKILINTQAASRKGIRDGDAIWVESMAGRVKGEAKVTECIHPEVVGIAGVFGSWSAGKPIARGKGVHFNTLLPLDEAHVDWLSCAVDACVRVNVHKASSYA